MREIESVFSERFPFWKELCETQKKALCESTRRVSYAKEAVVHDGGGCAGLTMVESGCIRVSLLSEDGREITLYRIHPGDMCLLSASCVIEAITFEVTFTAEEDSECLVLSAPAFSAVCESVPAAQIFALEKTVERFSDVMWVLQQVLFMSMDRRLAIYLLDEHARTGSVEIRQTHEAIARHVGSAREVVSRMLKYFENEGLVALSRGGVTLCDVRRLKDLAL